jgi:hypothetical protein
MGFLFKSKGIQKRLSVKRNDNSLINRLEVQMSFCLIDGEKKVLVIANQTQGSMAQNTRYEVDQFIKISSC